MPSPTEVALVTVPMAVYFYALGWWHGGQHPWVVAGVADLAWLMLGLSGLVAAGPVGRVAVASLFGPDPTPIAWLVWVMGLAIIAALVARTGRHRVIVYHVEPEQVQAATQAALAGLGGSYTATLNGFEDREARTSVTIRASDRTRTAVVEAQGDQAQSVMAAVGPTLRLTLRAVTRPVSSLSTTFFAASGLAMLAPVVSFIAFDPRGRRAVRVIGRWLGWN